MGGTQVTDVHVESCRPPGLAGAAQAACRPRHQFHRPAGMPATGGIRVAALFEPFEPVAAQRLQQPVASCAAVTVGGDQ
jgi:hypothetical protein